jgi:hypothetical protein
MITHDEKAYLYDRLNSIMAAITEIAREMAKWPTDTSAHDDESAGAR